MRRLVVLIGIAIALMLLPANAAIADAGEPASCVGHEASGVSPKGSSEEFPGGMPQLKAFLAEAFPDSPHGQIVRQFAQVHAGSHEACDAAFE